MIEMYEKICGMKLAYDGVLAKSQKESDVLWGLREIIPEATEKLVLSPVMISHYRFQQFQHLKSDSFQLSSVGKFHKLLWTFVMVI